MSKMDLEYPWLRVSEQLRNAAGWLEDHPEKRKKNLAAFAGAWVRREKERGLDNGRPPARVFANGRTHEA
jgi:hypothetical protein